MGPHRVRGDTTGVSVPAHADALRAAGVEFLTEAFRVFGSLSSRNRITRIRRFEKCPGGSTGQKLFLSVEYERSEPDLHTELFVKFSRDFSDPIRDERGKHEMESEVRFAELSRRPNFPIRVPTVYFADYHLESHTGILITERIDFGTGGIEPHHGKCLDYELADPIEHYRVIVRSLARIAAAHRTGRLSPDIDVRFPYDPETAAARNPIPYDGQQLRLRVAQFAEFATRCPQLFPANVASPALFATLHREAGRFVDHDAIIRRYLQSDPDFIALCHWNAHIDNAWFWRDGSGALHCGLMDWGHANRMNVAFALWGCLSAADLYIWDHHLEALLRLFTRELTAHGGPRLEVDELTLHLHLYAAVMGLSYFMDSPARILFRLPEAASAAGPRDPMFRANETARNQLHISSVFLNLWRTHDLGASLDRMLQKRAANK